MTDFVQFLYTQYIQSYIDAMPMDAADEYHHDLVKNECTPDLWTCLLYTSDAADD